MAFVFIMGLMIHAIAPGPDFGIFQASSSTTPRETPAGRDSLPTISQESESIDSFNVHPENRWSEGTSGTFAEDLENGEFSIDGFENTSSSNLRYRDAETTSGDIEVRWRLNASDSDAGLVNGSDFETVLMGLNVTTDEGSGNSSLNAYYYNSTHYNVRPTFTTADGTNWRSWNIESDYQDFHQLEGQLGPDGVDFIDGQDDIGGLATNTNSQGLYVGVPVAGGSDFIGFSTISQLIDTDDYSFLSVKCRSNDTTLTLQPFISILGGGSAVIGSIQTLGAGWTTLSWDLSADGDWTAIAAGYFFQVDETDGTLEGNEGLWIDYFHPTTNNDSSDLTFFEYETYYRAQSKYDLMESTLNWKISTDDDDKLTSTVQGLFKIEDFFEPDELIRDINLGEVGDIDYLFGLRSAGANATTWWDFYLADFTEFLFTNDTSLTDGTASQWLDAQNVFASSFVGNGSGSGAVFTAQKITVPEFDGCSGTFSVQELNSSTSHAIAHIEIQSVNPADGSVINELALHTGDMLINDYTDGAFANRPAGNHLVTMIADDGPPTSSRQYDTTFANHSEVAFSIFYNKLERKLSMQVEFFNGSELRRTTIEATVDVLGNEFVIRVLYALGNSAAGTQETFIQLDQWELTFRDIFSIPLPLPGVPKIDLPSPPSDPIGFMIQAFRDLAGIMGDVVAELVAMALTLTAMSLQLGSIVNQLTSILTNLTTIITKLTAIAVDIASLTAMIATLTAIAANIVTMTTDVGNIATGVTSMVSDLTAILVDTGLMQSDIFDIASDIGDIASDTLAMAADLSTLVSDIADVLDALVDALGDSWLGQIFATLIALALDVATEILDELITRAVAVMAAVVAAISDYFRGLTFAGVSIGDLIDIIDVWLLLWWTVAADIIGFGTNFLSIWAQVFLMGLLGIILIWAAATAKGDGFLFMEKMAWAMTRNVNPIAFILDVEIPLGLILLGNLFWTVFASYDWQGLLDPALMMPIALAHVTLGAAYEIPSLDASWQIFFDFMNSLLDEVFDVFLDILFFQMWGILVDLLDSDILGVAPEIVVFIICAGTAVMILMRGRF